MKKVEPDEEDDDDVEADEQPAHGPARADCVASRQAAESSQLYYSVLTALSRPTRPSHVKAPKL